MKKITPFLLGLCLLSFCKGSVNESSGITNNPASKKLRLAFVTNTTNEFWAIVRHGCNNAAQNLGNIDLDFRFFTDSTVEAQNQILNDLVASGVDGIAISPIDGEKQTVFLN